MNKLLHYAPLLSLLFTVIIGLFNLYFTVRKDRREVKQERVKQLETYIKEKGVYPPRKDKHQR